MSWARLVTAALYSHAQSVAGGCILKEDSTGDGSYILLEHGDLLLKE
tara:strand:- start:48 stop:188 length:141 start_codon:yes stop_codon:yes gene_type:complete